VLDPKGKILCREARTCDIPADSVSKPFETGERFAHMKGFTVPKKARYGQYQVALRVWDRKGKLVAHNEQDFKVVPKKPKA
jgi:hypothetical protein